jgi:hypothetical protein
VTPVELAASVVGGGSGGRGFTPIKLLSPLPKRDFCWVCLLTIRLLFSPGAARHIRLLERQD